VTIHHDWYLPHCLLIFRTWWSPTRLGDVVDAVETAAKMTTGRLAAARSAMLISGPTSVTSFQPRSRMSGGPKTPAALINLCAFPAAPQGKRYEMVNHTRSVIMARGV
jgi:hypothetical protein